MIPKIIHYCWFGNNPKPKFVKKCINSWKRYCPDYQIIEWNEKNFDVEYNSYVKEAYDAKKWSFVTDYARLWIIYNNGGIYLDTDVELVKNMDSLLPEPAFFGFEDNEHINTGVGFGAEKENPVVKCMLSDYENVHFLKKDQSFDLLTCPYRNTNAIKHLLTDISDTNVINRIEGAVIYPKEYFCPLDWETKTMVKTKNTYSIHWFNASWMQENQKILHDYQIFLSKMQNLFGKFLGGFLVKVVYLIFYPKKRKILKKL